MTADKLALRNVYTPDRPAQEVQGVLRRVASAVNGIRRCVELVAYADDTAWSTTLLATISATYIDTPVQVAFSQAVKVGDVLEVNGRAPVLVNTGDTGEYIATVYEDSQKLSTTRPETLWRSTSDTKPEAVPLSFLHTVTRAGMCKVAVQMRSTSGGDVYILSRGSLTAKVWRS